MLSSRQTQNKLNLARILHLIWKEQAISRTEIARCLQLDKSTITNASNKLLDLGLIEEWKQGNSAPGAGRKPTLIRIKTGFGSILGIEFRPESYQAVFTNLRGEILHSQSGKHHISRENLLPELSELIGKLCREVKEVSVPVAAVGVGLSGIIDTRKGSIRYSIPLQIHSELNLTDSLIKTHGIPVIVENDANACAWAELNNAQEGNTGNFMAVLGETPGVQIGQTPPVVDAFSVGIGLALQGQIYHGPDYFAGEFRSIFWNGEPDAQFSVHKKDLQDFHSNKEIRTRTFTELSRQISLIINTFNVNGLYICGGLEGFSEEIIPVLRHCIEENWSYQPQIPRKVSISNSSYAEKAVAVGAANLVLHSLFGVPDYLHADGGLIGKIRDRLLEHMAHLTNT
ncbi:ROK family transcriptional regulator [Spirochaeta dissipatitropha]